MTSSVKRRVVAALCAALSCATFACTRSSDAPAETALTSSTASRFADVTQSAGIRYRWEVPGKRPYNILQTIGNGCAFLDANRDGNPDVLLVGPRTALYEGDGKGQFTDVSAQWGLTGLRGSFLGCAVGDMNGDGWDDVYLSAYRGGALLHNQGGKTFRDVTRAAGIAPQPWGTSAAWAEARPGSGKLDLFVGNYADFGPEQKQLCLEAGLETSCGPRAYGSLRGVFYRNDSSGGKIRFTDVTKASGMASASGKALGAAWADWDGSGRQSLALANDEEPGNLMTPTGKGVYRDQAQEVGVAYDRDGNHHAGMGLDWGDFDGDGRLDLFVTTFHGEVKCLYRNEGGLFTESAYPAGVAQPSLLRLTFGTRFFDMDNDGWLDLVLANGHVQDNIQKIRADIPYRQATQVFRNGGAGAAGELPRFTDVSSECGPGVAKEIIGRGLATGDYDNDGRVDLLIVDSEGEPLLLHNEQKAGNWVGIRLEGVRSNRNGYGAMLTATVGGQKLVRHCHADGSYLSSSDPRVHFGLGASTQIDTLTVRWPSGKTDTLTNVPAGAYLTVREGSGAMKAEPARVMAAK